MNKIEFHKILGYAWIAAQMEAAQEGLSSMGYVSTTNTA
jgi:hypothetical protein